MAQAVLGKAAARNHRVGSFRGLPRSAASSYAEPIIARLIRPQPKRALVCPAVEPNTRAGLFLFGRLEYPAHPFIAPTLTSHAARARLLTPLLEHRLASVIDIDRAPFGAIRHERR